MTLFKAIQKHWHFKVSDKANFINHCSQDHEVLLNWRSMDDIFETLFQKSGSKLSTETMESVAESDEDNNSDDDDKETAAAQLQFDECEEESTRKRQKFESNKGSKSKTIVARKAPSGRFFDDPKNLWCI